MDLSSADLFRLLPTLAPVLELVRAHLQAPPPVLYIQASTFNVSHLVRALVPDQSRAVSLDCIELYEPRAIYDRALNGLAHWNVSYTDKRSGVPNWDARGRSSKMPDGSWDVHDLPPAAQTKGAVGVHANDSMASFVSALQRVFELDDDILTPRFLIFEHAERLASISESASGAMATHANDGAFFAALTRLGELTGRPLIPIFISSLEPSKLVAPLGKSREGPVIVVPALGRAVCHHYQAGLIETTLADGQAATLFRSLVDHLYVCLEAKLAPDAAVDELAFIAGRCWPQWKLPVEKGTVKAAERDKLAIKIKPIVEAETDRLGALRSLATVEAEPISTSQEFYTSSPSKRAKIDEPKSALASSLPRIAKLLLIAAFLASHNPPRTDIRLFATVAEERDPGTPSKTGRSPRKKSSPRKAARAGAAAVAGKRISRLTGPSVFPIERMLAIFEGLAGHVDVSDDEVRRERLVQSEFDVGSQTATLLALRLILPTTNSTLAAGGFDKLNGIRLKCNVGSEEIDPLAKSIGIKLADWLYDSDL